MLQTYRKRKFAKPLQFLGFVLIICSIYKLINVVENWQFYRLEFNGTLIRKYVDSGNHMTSKFEYLDNGHEYGMFINNQHFYEHADSGDFISKEVNTNDYLLVKNNSSDTLVFKETFYY